jgi:hypothetical protein
MPKGTVEEKSWPFEEAWYRMRLQSVLDEETKFTYKAHHAAVKRGDAAVGEEGTMRSWKWHMTFVGGENDGRKFVEDTFPRISDREGDKARMLYEAFLGRPLELGEAYDTDLVEGREADCFVAHDLEKEARTGKQFSTISQAVPVGQADGPVETWVGSPSDDEPPF